MPKPPVGLVQVAITQADFDRFPTVTVYHRKRGIEYERIIEVTSEDDLPQKLWDVIKDVLAEESGWKPEESRAHSQIVFDTRIPSWAYLLPSLRGEPHA